jgi:uncharacterized protein involved in response to NO
MVEHSEKARPPLRSDMTVRQVAADYPGCREVLRRYGEPEGRPTKFGHLEPLDRFACRHGLDLNQLLAELAQAAGVEVDRQGRQTQSAHRLFLVSALAVTLSLGAGWGAWLLWEISRAGQFTAAPAGHVVAHGAAQLWGFIALFVVGIALRYLPMSTGGPPPRPLFCRLLLAAFLLGVVGGFFWSLGPEQVGWLGPLSGFALVAAALGFLVFLFRQLRGKVRFTWARLILAAGVWMTVWAGVTLVLRYRESATGPGSYSESLRQLLMELAIFGFTLNAIYGFGQRLLPGIVGNATPHPGALESTFWLHNTSVFLMLPTSLGWPPWVEAAAAVVLTAAALTYVVGMHGFFRVRRSSPRPEVGEALLVRYVQLAFFWLLAAMALLTVGDFYPVVRGQPLPHAYLGSVRHALTVGFMTTLILGVGQRLLPILEHTLLAWPRLIAPTFLLIAAGNLLRVSTEMATLFVAPAFILMPFSALLELTALALFAANIVRTLWPPLDPLLRTGRATLRTSVALLLAEHPWLEDQLMAWGIGYVGRVRSVPRELTLGTLARTEDKDPQEVLTRINDLLQQHPKAST